MFPETFSPSHPIFLLRTQEGSAVLIWIQTSMKQMVFGLKQAQPKSKQSLHSCQIYSFLRYYTWQPTCSYTFKNKYIFLNLCTCSKYLYCQKKKFFFKKRKKARREKGGEKRGGGGKGEKGKKKKGSKYSLSARKWINQCYWGPNPGRCCSPIIALESCAICKCSGVAGLNSKAGQVCLNLIFPKAPSNGSVS